MPGVVRPMRTDRELRRIERSMPASSRRGPLLRLGLLGLILVAAVVVAIVATPSLDQVRVEVARAGVAGGVVFVLLYAALTVALVPGTALTITSGLLFGPVRGTAYAICGATIGATIAFGVGRALGREGVRSLLGRRAPRIEGALDDTGFLAMLVLRLLPVVPFNALNYAAGMTGIRRRAYVAATVLGIAPGTAAVATAGSSATDPTSGRFLVSAGAGLAILAGSLLLARRQRRDRAARSDR